MSLWKSPSLFIAAALFGWVATCGIAEDAKTHSAITPVPREGNWVKRHEAINERAKAGDVDLLFIGDSITQGWNDNAVWKKYYGERKAMNAGIGGDRTQHVLWRLDNGNIAGSVQIQPGGRVALLNMQRPVGGIIPRTLTASGILDAHGGALVSSGVSVMNGLTEGVAIRGRVARADGSPAIDVPVTLTMYDLFSAFTCEPFIVRPCQVFTDTNGFFEIDFVMSGVGYSVSATDISGLTGEALQVILESAGGDAFNRARLL